MGNEDTGMDFDGLLWGKKKENTPVVAPKPQTQPQKVLEPEVLDAEPEGEADFGDLVLDRLDRIIELLEGKLVQKKENSSGKKDFLFD